MQKRNPDLGWVQAGNALGPMIARLADKMGHTEQAHSRALRSGSAEREAVASGVCHDRLKAGSDGAGR